MSETNERLEAYLAALEQGYFEVTEGFRELQDEHVWTRPAPGLLSIGEIAGHLAYWEAGKFAGEGTDGTMKPDLSKCKISSSLIDDRFSYYTGTIDKAPSPEHLAMTAQQVCDELVRIHKEAVSYFRDLSPTLSEHAPGWPDWVTYEEMAKYAVFHVAYHTGQIYSARYLQGENPPDN